MKCEFCGGVVSWVGSLIDNPSTKCAGCGRTNCQEVEPFDPERLEPDNHEYDELGLPPEPDGVMGTPAPHPQTMTSDERYEHGGKQIEQMLRAAASGVPGTSKDQPKGGS